MAHTEETRKRAYNKMKRLRQEWLKKHGPCAVCATWGYLHIHHRDPSQKVSHKVWSWEKDRRNAELDKCIVLCAECHVKLHALERVKHGISQYDKGCRCAVCMQAKFAKYDRKLQREGRELKITKRRDSIIDNALVL